jgi:uncharacterized repeat protein (TIGR01451 family)
MVSGTGTVSELTPDPNTANNTATFQPTIGAGTLGTDVAITMIGSADPVTVGDTLLYTVTITNNGPRVATGIAFSDTLPTGVTFLPDQSSPGISHFGQFLGVPVGALAPGDFIRVFVAVQPIAAGSILNSSHVVATTADTDSSNDTANLPTTVLKSPSITVLTTSLSPSNPGQATTFTATVTSPTIGVPTGSIVFSEGNTVYATEKLDGSGTASFQTSALSPGVHTIVASYSGDAVFNASAITLPQAVTGAAANTADLRLQVESTPNPVAVGSSLTYMITVTNNGPSAASHVLVTANLPASNIASFGSAHASQGTATQAGGSVTATLGGLAVGGTATVTVVVTPAAAGAVLLSAAVTGSESDPNTNNNSSSATATAQIPTTPRADLSVALRASQTSVAQGQVETLTLIASNLGPDAASGATVVDTLPAGMTIVSTSQGTAANGVVTIPLGPLAAGASVSITIVAQATASGALVDAATIGATGPADPSSNNNAATVTVTSNAPITLDKTIDLSFGTISAPAAFGFPSEDDLAISAHAPAAILDAILGTTGLDARALAGLRAILGDAGSNGTPLDFFRAASEQPELSYGGVVQANLAGNTAMSALDEAYAAYLQAVTLGAGQVVDGSQTSEVPLVFSFPALAPASSGQVVNGQLTVHVLVHDASLEGLVGTNIVITASQATSAPAQPVTFTATVTGNGHVHPESTGDAKESITFFDGAMVLGKATLDSSGQATLVVSTLAAGPHMITADFEGTTLFAPSRSIAVSQLVRSPEGPRVMSVERFGFHMHPTTLVLQFDEALASLAAENPANYVILAPGANGKLSTRDKKLVAIKSIEYDPATFTVTLHPASLISLWHPYRLIVRGSTPGGLMSLYGTPLEGAGRGLPGTDYTTKLTHATLVMPPRPARSSVGLHRHDANDRRFSGSTRPVFTMPPAPQLHSDTSRDSVAARRHGEVVTLAIPQPSRHRIQHGR